MSLATDIKTRMFAAMKAGLTTEKEILRVALGEITMAQARSAEELKDEEVQQILKKLLKSNREALSASPDAETQTQLEEENRILEGLLPRTLGVEDIITALGELAPALRAAPQPGPAVGMAIKHLKQAGLNAEAPTITEAVQKIRG